MDKTAKRHTIYYFIQDEYGCTPYVVQWYGRKDRFSQQEVARAAEKRHARRCALKYPARDKEVRVTLGSNRIWITIGSVLWWFGAYTIAVIKFLLQLSWKIIVVFFVLFFGQILLGLLLRR